MADVWDSAMKGATAVHVMAVLGNSADDDGTNCFPGTRLIARRARVSERTVIRTIQELEREGWLCVIQRGSGAGYRTQYRLNVSRLHEQAEQTREEERRRKGCHHVTFPDERKRVTITTKKGDTGIGKGDIDGLPLFVLPVSDPSQDPLPPNPPLPREGEHELALNRAVEQIRNALNVSSRRELKLVRSQVALACEKGDEAPTIALGMIAAVREQDRLYAAGELKYKFGLRKFIGLGLWCNRDSWGWDIEAIKLHAQAAVGSR